MKYKQFFKILILSIVLLLIPFLVHSARPNGETLVGTKAQYGRPAAISNADSATIIAWSTYENDIYKIRVQKLSSVGTPEWDNGGTIIAANNQGCRYPSIILNGSGGVIIAWADLRRGDGYADIYAQSLDSNGIPQWAENGVRVFEEGAGFLSPTIVSDGLGGAIIVSFTNNNPTGDDIYAQRIGSDGTVQWNINGVPIVDTIGGQWRPVGVSDGAGGAIIAWQDDRMSSSNYLNDVYAQRINIDGTVQWNINGVPVCSRIENQSEPLIVTDGAGGGIITWNDTRSDGGDVYVQRIDSGGTCMWAINGIRIGSDHYVQDKPVITSDDSGGVIIAYRERDSVNTTLSYLRAQYINSNGIRQWWPDGMDVYSYRMSYETELSIAKCNSGVLIGWMYYGGEYAGPRIYVQKVTMDGFIEWSYDSLHVSSFLTFKKNHLFPQITKDGVVVWYAENDGGSGSIFAQKISENNEYLFPWTRSVQVKVYEGWNIMSLPSKMENNLSQRLYPDAIAVGENLAWPYSLTGYYSIPNIENGMGYWMKFPTGDSITLIGGTLDSLIIPVTQGWNLIGSLRQSIQIGNIVTDPPEMLTSQFYGYNNGYFIAPLLEPGKGYWVKVNQNGMIKLGIDWLPLTHSRKFLMDEIPPSPPNKVQVVPTEFSLTQNYPNPFNPSTTIKFSLPSDQFVTLNVYNMLGQEMINLVREIKLAGEYEVIFNAFKLPSGIYTYRLQAGSYVETKKMLLLK